MKLITRFELAAKSESELYALLREVFNELARSDPDSHEPEMLWLHWKIFRMRLMHAPLSFKARPPTSDLYRARRHARWWRSDHARSR